MNKTDGNQNNKLVVIPGAKPGHDVPPLDAVASLSLYEVNQDILQGKIPQTVYLKKGRIVVGRGSQSDIILNAQRDGKFIISRNHAAFQIDEDSCVLEDLGAVNGTYVNGMRINKYEVKNGDIVQFGGMCDIPAGFILQHSDVSVKYKFHFLPKSVPPPPLTRSTSATKANKRNRETASTPGAAAVVNELVSETTNSSSAQNNDNKILATTTATIANNSSGNSKTNKKAKTNNSAFVSSSANNNISHGNNSNNNNNNAGNAVAVPPSENLQEMRISDSGPPLSSSSHNNHNTSVVLEEIQSMKTIQQKEMAELKKQLFSLQQTISKSEEQQQQQQLITRQQQATSLIATPIGVGKEELLEKENQRLKEEIDLLRKKEQEKEREKEKEQATATATAAAMKEEKEKDSHRTPSGATKNNLNKNNSTTTKTTKEEKLLAVQPSSSSSCQIDLGSLRSPLNCILCHEFLLDAAVLRCSHGFCRLCIEKHVRLGKSTCPICNDPPLLPLSNHNNKNSNNKNNKKNSSSSVSRDLKHFYHRSDQLDSLVWILLEASPEEDRQVMISNYSIEEWFDQTTNCQSIILFFFIRRSIEEGKSLTRN
jgi:hypothetical protein